MIQFNMTEFPSFQFEGAWPADRPWPARVVAVGLSSRSLCPASATAASLRGLLLLTFLSFVHRERDARGLIVALSLRGVGLSRLKFAVGELFGVASTLERDLAGRDARVAVDGGFAFLRVFGEFVGGCVLAFVSLFRGRVFVDRLVFQAANFGERGGFVFGVCFASLVTQLLSGGAVVQRFDFGQAFDRRFVRSLRFEGGDDALMLLVVGFLGFGVLLASADQFGSFLELPLGRIASLLVFALLLFELGFRLLMLGADVGQPLVGGVQKVLGRIQVAFEGVVSGVAQRRARATVRSARPAILRGTRFGERDDSQQQQAGAHATNQTGRFR